MMMSKKTQEYYDFCQEQMRDDPAFQEWLDSLDDGQQQQQEQQDAEQ
jgi:hypothetical protein